MCFVASVLIASTCAFTSSSESKYVDITFEMYVGDTRTPATSNSFSIPPLSLRGRGRLHIVVEGYLELSKSKQRLEERAEEP